MEQRETISACKHMRRECSPDCIFAPLLTACDDVGRILQSLPVEELRVATESLVFEAEARIRDPIFGCVGYICFLQQHRAQMDRHIREAEAELSAAGYQPPPPPPPEQHSLRMPQLTLPQQEDLLWPIASRRCLRYLRRHSCRRLLGQRTRMGRQTPRSRILPLDHPTL